MADTLRVGDLDLCWDAFGDRRDPAMILVMGLGRQMTSWRDELCEQIAAGGRWVVRFDNRDVGLSTRLDHLGVPDIPKLLLARGLRRRAAVPYRIEDMADDVLGLMDALDIESADLVGLSMGGMIVQSAAIRAPSRVRSLTSMMSSTGHRRLPWPTMRALWWLARRAPEEIDARIDHYLRLFDVIAGGKYHEPVEVATQKTRADIERTGIDTSGDARQLAAIIMQEDRTEGLRGLDLPALIIHGHADPLVLPAHGRATAAAIPGAQELWIHDMGHELPVQLYDVFARNFLENARRAG